MSEICMYKIKYQNLLCHCGFTKKMKGNMDPWRFMVLLLALLVPISMSFCGVGGEGSKQLSKEDHMELDKQVMLLNKPPIKTIQDEAGGIFDCIDIMAQPAFDHPLLKNHKIKMRPTSYPRESKVGTTSSTSTRSSTLLTSPKAIGCPRGTVPVRRVQKDDLIRAKSLLQSYTTTGTNPYPKDKTSSHWKQNLILNPRVMGADWSSGQMWIENGPTEDFNTIQAGWTVSPLLFGDYSTRSFVFWRGNGNKEGCYNLLCAGFIQVNNDHPLGQLLPTRDYDHFQLEFPLSIEQDRVTKDWWLLNTKMPSLPYGYWPKELFSHLEGGAPIVAWGGLTIGERNKPYPVPMGTGYFPDRNFNHSGYFIHMKVINVPSYLKGDPYQLCMEKYADVPGCYHIEDYGNLLEETGYTIMYGGPGGSTCGD